MPSWSAEDELKLSLADKASCDQNDQSWASTGLSYEVAKGLQSAGFAVPYPLQKRILFTGKEFSLYVEGPHYTGRTVASVALAVDISRKAMAEELQREYATALKEGMKVDQPPNSRVPQKSIKPFVIIILPTHDGCNKIFRIAKNIIEGSGLNLRCLVQYGGTKYPRYARKFE